MARDKDAKNNLDWLEEELLSEEAGFAEEYDEEDCGEPDEDAAVFSPPEKRNIGGLLLLAVLETAAIAALARWWLQWL